MITTSAVVLCLLLTVLAVFQVSLVLGAPLGRFAWGGQHRVLPATYRVGSVVSLGLYVAIAMIGLQRAGVADLGLPTGFTAVAAWVVAGYFLLGIGMNAASRSRPERSVMTPLCAVLCLLSFAVALG